ncbi:hypothetical protein [Actinoplanes sp. CA-252034]|uniref:hypothetical protein n=1 Tax=Actinoplanes sp. CA-252034 TaxID=3239906 RepID=UPI003D98E1E6
MDMGGFGMDWKIVGTGSANLTWAVGEELLELRTTYVGDGLQSLLQAALDLRIGSSATLAWLPTEPGAHVFVFGGAAEEVNVQILFLRDEYAKDPWQGARRRWVGRIRVDAFTAATAKMAQTVLEQHGEVGYRRAWGDIPFPSQQLTLLQQAITSSSN